MRIGILLAALAIAGCSDDQRFTAATTFTAEDGSTLTMNGSPRASLPGGVFAHPSMLRMKGAASPDDRDVSPPSGSVGTAISLVELCVDAEGKTSYVTLMTSSGFPVLDDSTVELVKGTRLTPARNATGEAVAYCGYVFPVSWTIPEQG